jgi:hypothetical protein
MVVDPTGVVEGTTAPFSPGESVRGRRYRGLRAGANRWGWLGVVGATTALVRLPLLGLPLDPDEGGYAYIARRWAAGSPLYSPAAWVDRPPGLMLVFRWLGDLSYTPVALRLGAMLAAVVLALGSAYCARALAGRRAGAVAGILAGVVLAGPFIEGYQLNGELLASAVGTWGVAIAVSWRAGRLGARWLLLAGILAGAAPLMKQTAVDGLLAVLCVALAHAVATKRLSSLLVVALGASVPLGVAAVWAGVTGWSRAWYAVAGFQADIAHTQSLGERVSVVVSSVRHVTPDLFGLSLAASVAATVLVRQRRRLWPVPVWAVAAVMAAVTSPFGHPHYWVQTVAPLSVLAASVVPGLGRMSAGHRRVATVALSVALVFPLLAQGVVVAHSPWDRPALLTGDRRQATDTDVAAWLRAHDPPGGKVYAFVGAAELYLLAGRDTGYPYLWYEAVQHVPGASALLERWLLADNGPQYVVVYQNPNAVDPQGQLAWTLDDHYTRVATIDGYEILKRRGPRTGSSTSSAR